MMQGKRLSAVIGAENYAYLHALVQSGKAKSVGATVDRVVEMVHQLENRAELERATAKYFEELSPEAVAEEHALTEALRYQARNFNFDQH